MPTLPDSADLPTALDLLVGALEILDDSSEAVIAARVADVVDMLTERLLTPSG